MYMPMPSDASIHATLVLCYWRKYVHNEDIYRLYPYNIRCLLHEKECTFPRLLTPLSAKLQESAIGESMYMSMPSDASIHGTLVPSTMLLEKVCTYRRILPTLSIQRQESATGESMYMSMPSDASIRATLVLCYRRKYVHDQDFFRLYPFNTRTMLQEEMLWVEFF